MSRIFTVRFARLATALSLAALVALTLSAGVAARPIIPAAQKVPAAWVASLTTTAVGGAVGGYGAAEDAVAAAGTAGEADERLRRPAAERTELAGRHRRARRGGTHDRRLSDDLARPRCDSPSPRTADHGRARRSVAVSSWPDGTRRLTRPVIAAVRERDIRRGWSPSTATCAVRVRDAVTPSRAIVTAPAIHRHIGPIGRPAVSTADAWAVGACFAAKEERHQPRRT